MSTAINAFVCPDCDYDFPFSSGHPVSNYFGLGVDHDVVVARGLQYSHGNSRKGKYTQRAENIAVQTPIRMGNDRVAKSVSSSSVGIKARTAVAAIFWLGPGDD